jgi:triosephosphate isomerase
MNGSLETIRPLVAGVIEGLAAGCKAEVAICPPAIYLSEVSQLIGNSEIALGSQDVSEHESGAFTGELSVDMLRDFNCSYAIVGHSERRSIYNESDAQVAEKFATAVAKGLTPILCVGELQQEREAGTTEEVVARQLDVVLDKVGVEAFNKAVIAYEPVWAIGTGLTATPEQAQEVHAFIRLRIARNDNTVADAIRILYGGSVKPGNAKEIFSMADVDGGLIGGASLVADDFLAICQATR